jgi:hypothetical protein
VSDIKDHVFFTAISPEKDKQAIADWILHALFLTKQATTEQ